MIFSLFNLDEAVQDLVLGAPWFRSCERLCAYISCKPLREVDTSKILSEILEPSVEGVSVWVASYS